jgi:hypothetical protein
MLLKSCLNCSYHEITSEHKEQTSHCSKENCYSRYTKCIAHKAFTSFLKDESLRQNRRFPGNDRPLIDNQPIITCEPEIRADDI